MLDGGTLSTIFEDTECASHISYIFDEVTAVIVFRSSPNDKAAVVNFVQKLNDKAYTLSIGDGGNDVNMIQSAHIGVGIMGKEGNQAAQFSDYAIPNFQGLNRLVFWHGRQFGTKAVTFLIPLNLFKGFIFTGPVFFAQFDNGFSGLAIFNDFYYSLFNVWLTTFSCATFVWTDQDISFNFNKYKKDSTQKVPHTNKEYSPIVA